MLAHDAIREFHRLTQAIPNPPHIQWAVYYAPEEGAVCIRGTIRARRNRHSERRMLDVVELDEPVAIEFAQREIHDIAHALSALVDKGE